MKVTGNNGINIINIYNNNKSKASGEVKKASSGQDTVEISSAGKEMAKYAAGANEISDVRLQKVNDIKSRIQSGTYKVSSEDLAAKILEAIKEEK